MRDYFRREFESLENKRSVHLAERSPGAIHIFGKQLVDFATWDVFGIAFDGEVRKQVVKALEDEPLSAGSDRFTGGSSALHSRCEGRIAQFLGQESALLFSSRNQAILSLITAVCSERDTLFVDAGGSAAADAAYFVGAEVVEFDSRDGTLLQGELNKRKGLGRSVVVIESHTSFGVAADLVAINELCGRTNSFLFVDETYGLGLTGLRGAGAAEVLLPPGHINAQFGGFGYGTGGYGGFICGDPYLVSIVLNRSRTLLAEPAPPPSMAALLLSALDKVELLGQERIRLSEAARECSEEISKSGFTAFSSKNSPILSVKLHSRDEGERLRRVLLDVGVYTLPSLYCASHRCEALRLIFSISNYDRLPLLVQAFSKVRS